MGRKRRFLRVVRTGLTVGVVFGLLVAIGCLPTVQTRREWSLPYYPRIAVQVVDAESGEPIEGAVALGVWTLTKALIETHTEVYKVMDAVSDAQGRFTIGGCCWRTDLDAPELTVYKRGYVAWNNNTRFRHAGFKKDFAWKNGLVVKMERWQDEYSFIEHEHFISRHTFPAMTKAFADAMEWEWEGRQREQDRITERLKREGVIR